MDGMLMRLSTANATGFCSEEEARAELTDPRDPKDNTDLAWFPYDESRPSLYTDDGVTVKEKHR